MEKFWKRMNLPLGWRRDEDPACDSKSADGYYCARPKGHDGGHCCDHASWRDGDGPRDPMMNKPRPLE